MLTMVFNILLFSSSPDINQQIDHQVQKVQRIVHRLTHDEFEIRRDALEVIERELELDRVPLARIGKSMYSSGNRRVRRPSHDGGGFIQHGRKGTRVYTGDYVPRVYPTLQRACAIRHVQKKNDACLIEYSWTQGSRRPWRLSPDLAIKDIPDQREARFESHANANLAVWFAQDKLLSSCIFHPRLNCVDLTIQVGDALDNTHRLIALRKMDGTAAQIPAVSLSHVCRLARDVIAQLAVLHRRNVLHMDIKPHNILFELTHTNTPRPRIRFHLADFGLIDKASSVLMHAIRGGSPSGTEGYVSPIVTRPGQVQDDNEVYEQVHAVAVLSNAVPKAASLGLDATAIKVGAFWSSYFAKERARIYASKDPSRVLKADLHSLGLTLTRLAGLRSDGTLERPSHACLRMSKTSPNLLRFIAKLFFFRRTDFYSATGALPHARSLVCTSAPKRRSQSHSKRT
jgi:serine/threonine protein kinase